MENETKEKALNFVSLFFSIIIAGSLFSGLGRMVAGIKFYTGAFDGLFIGLSLFLVIFLSSIERIKIRQLPLILSIVIGFLVGGIPGIIAQDNLTFFTAGLAGSLICLSFTLTEKYLEDKTKDTIKILSYYLSAGLIAGLISGTVFGICFELTLIESINIKIVVLDALYGAVWSGLIVLGIKLAMLYLKPLIKMIVSPILSSMLYGLAIAIGAGIFGVIVETITYTTTNFDMTATGAKPLSQAVTISFFRDAMFGVCFGFLFNLLPKLIPNGKLRNPMFIISGGLAGYLVPKILQEYIMFVLTPLDGAILGIGLGLGIFISNIKESEKNKIKIWTLIFSSLFGFFAIAICKYIEASPTEKSFFYLLSFGLIGTIYAVIIILAGFLCDYYLEIQSKSISINQ